MSPARTPPAWQDVAARFPASLSSAKELGLALHGFFSFLRTFSKPVAEVSSFLEPQSLLSGPYEQGRSRPSAGEDAVVAGDWCFGVSPALLTAQGALGGLPSQVTQVGSWRRRCAALPAALADADQVNQPPAKRNGRRRAATRRLRRVPCPCPGDGSPAGPSASLRMREPPRFPSSSDPSGRHGLIML